MAQLAIRKTVEVDQKSLCAQACCSAKAWRTWQDPGCCGIICSPDPFVVQLYPRFKCHLGHRCCIFRAQNIHRGRISTVDQLGWPVYKSIANSTASHRTVMALSQSMTEMIVRSFRQRRIVVLTACPRTPVLVKSNMRTTLRDVRLSWQRVVIIATIYPRRRSYGIMDNWRLFFSPLA